MQKTFVIQNQHGHFLSKQKEWTDGSDRRALFHTPHKDEVINMIVELSTRDVDLRATRLECETDNDGHPIVTASETPQPRATNGADAVDALRSGDRSAGS